ncbi:MAG: 4Fe-4S binding protein [Christensenellaceae bacterium]|nr:4Fe-4S binding protein [Christensenellaceae bacterium]
MVENKRAKINDNCIACGSCASACPVDAIKLAESGDHYEVDMAVCIACGSCASACPVDAIKLVEVK